MEENQKKIPRTAVAVQQATKKRLQSHMHYGETIDGMINKLIDFFEENLTKEKTSKIDFPSEDREDAPFV